MKLALLLSDLFWGYEPAIQDIVLSLQVYFFTDISRL